jgi:hypothetical protein
LRQAFARFCFRFLIDVNVFIKPSADKLRAKSGKTVMGGEAAGAYNICEAVAMGALGQFLRPQVLPDLQGKARAARSLSADLIFWLLLDQAKSNSLSRGE